MEIFSFYHSSISKQYLYDNILIRKKEFFLVQKKWHFHLEKKFPSYRKPNKKVCECADIQISFWGLENPLRLSDNNKLGNRKDFPNKRIRFRERIKNLFGRFPRRRKFFSVDGTQKWINFVSFCKRSYPVPLWLPSY